MYKSEYKRYPNTKGWIDPKHNDNPIVKKINIIPIIAVGIT